MPYTSKRQEEGSAHTYVPIHVQYLYSLTTHTCTYCSYAQHSAHTVAMHNTHVHIL